VRHKAIGESIAPVSWIARQKPRVSSPLRAVLTTVPCIAFRGLTGDPEIVESVSVRSRLRILRRS
jgi:hypothetical protein